MKGARTRKAHACGNLRIGVERMLPPRAAAFYGRPGFANRTIS